MLLLALLCLPVLAPAQVAPVELATVERRDVVETLRLTGTLTAPYSARLSPDVEGRLVSLEVDVGARVRQGETLFRLDDELARIDLQQAKAAVHEAEANLADARRRVVEVQRLVAEQSFPQSEARSLESQVERNAAILERRRAELAYTEATLRRHSLEAPFAGVIAAREADPGERVDTDSNVLLLVATDRLQLDLRIPQRYFSQVATGTPVSLEFEALPGQRLEAEVALVAPVSDPQARTFLARTRIDNTAGRLTPGMSARAVVRIGKNRRAAVVPRDALIRYPDGRTIVWVATIEGDSHVVRERLVRTGLTFDGSIEVLEGLVEGERIVIRGNEALQQGQQVHVSGES